MAKIDKDQGAELIEDLSEVLNESIHSGIPYVQMLESLAALTAMALSITNPLTDDKDRLEKFRVLLKDSLAAQSAIEGKGVKELII